MNGVHDMGGMAGFGPIEIEQHEPLFHAAWEARVRGMVYAVVDERYNWDEFRYAIERVDPVVYLSSSYYERWLTALERYVIEKGVIAETELRARSVGAAPQPGTPPLPRRSGPAARAPRGSPEPRFGPGDAVRARNIHPRGHTRLPRYVRGKRGIIDRILGVFALPDTTALGLPGVFQPVYAVRFSARELWGDGASERDSVCVDLWESYIEPKSPARGEATL